MQERVTRRSMYVNNERKRAEGRSVMKPEKQENNPPVVECKVNQRRWITSQRQDRHFCTVRYTFLFLSTLSIGASAISTIVAARTSSFQYVRKAWLRQSSPLQRLHHPFLYYSGTRTQSYHTFPTLALGNMRRQYMVS